MPKQTQHAKIKPQRAGFQVDFLRAGRPIFSGNRRKKGGSFDARIPRSLCFTESWRSRWPRRIVGVQVIQAANCALVHLVDPTTGKMLEALPQAGASESRRGQGARDDLTTII
jgi:hypothetical protein